MTEAELAESIYWEAEQYIPFDIQDVNLDYQILDGAQRRPGPRAPMDVLLVAAKKEKIADYTGVIRQAGRSAGRRRRRRLRAAERLRGQLRHRTAAPSSSCSTPGASATNINILNGDQSVFTRDISIGGNAYTEALQKELNLPFELAEQLKRGIAGRRRHVRATRGRCCGRSPRTCCSRSRRPSTSSRPRPPRIASTASWSAAARRASTASPRCSASGSRRRSRRFDPFKRVALRRQEVRRGVGRRRRADGGRRGRPRAAPGGRPMIRINLLAVDRERSKRRR